MNTITVTKSDGVMWDSIQEGGAAVLAGMPTCVYFKIKGEPIRFTDGAGSITTSISKGSAPLWIPVNTRITIEVVV